MSLTGSLSETYRYLPFGERYAGTHTTHQYTGKERDQESGLDYFGARYYTWMGVYVLALLMGGVPFLLFTTECAP